MRPRSTTPTLLNFSHLLAFLAPEERSTLRAVSEATIVAASSIWTSSEVGAHRGLPAVHGGCPPIRCLQLGGSAAPRAAEAGAQRCGDGARYFGAKILLFRKKNHSEFEKNNLREFSQKSFLPKRKFSFSFSAPKWFLHFLPPAFDTDFLRSENPVCRHRKRVPQGHQTRAENNRTTKIPIEFRATDARKDL